MKLIYIYLNIAGSGETPPEDPTETEEVNPPVVSEPPFVPNILEGPGTNNVNVRGRADVAPDTVPDADTADARPAPDEQPVADSGDRPSLHKALFTYALPVVCAWFGTIVTDLF